MKRKSLVALGCVGMMLASTPVLAASPENTDSENGIVKTVYETDSGTFVEGMIGHIDGIDTYWLANGPLYQYPTEGGTWEYGYWSGKVRSYYTVDKCHGSTVRYNKKESRSINTASGRKSIAELYASQSKDAVDEYYYRTTCD